MTNIKRNHPGIAYLSGLSELGYSDFINLANEDTDLLPSGKLLKAATHALTKGFNNYTDLNGYLQLRKNISQFVMKEFAYTYDAHSEITITAGISQAVSTAISSLIREGDEVIIFEPAFYVYDLMIMANGGRPVYIQLKQPDFHIDWDEVQKVINSRTKMIIINSPNFPTGSVFSVTDMEKLAKIINGTKIIILSDESFHQIVFDGIEHLSVARFPKVAEQTMIISSFGKALHVEGWKLAYCLAPAKIMADFRKLHNVLSYSVNAPLQVALSSVLEDDEIFKGIVEKFQAKRDLLLDGLKDTKFKFTPSKGTYFQVLNYSDVFDGKEGDFCNYLLETKKLALMPLSYYFHDLIDQKCVRVCFGKSDETLKKAIEILNSL
ncbi:MAG: aminotransferase class I/II-fold pyridoxal phosphate-dependent enzyme [Bacteroidota bacterium]|nr:aminotransferase class I/II-fold pyridoxal phosphate-dependent enzyme [Bacteroidota bacterium]